MAVPHRSASIDALYRNSLSVWPEMTIYWIGDLTHQGEVSGHNPDDYPGVRAELIDDDTDPEVRALDFMLGLHFTAQDGWDLVNALISGVDKHRVYYVIYQGKIWRRATNFRPETYGGSDSHTNHVHVSGYVSDDANGSDWQSVLALGEHMPTTEELMQSAHAFLLAVLTADTPVERQVRDMIMGGVQSPANGRGLLTKVMEAIAVDGGSGGLTPDQVRAIVREELDKTKLSGGA